MRFIADLHIHSKYSRATSPEMDLEHITEWAKIKGLELVGTGDFTHPAWFKELRFKLEPNGQGLYRYKGVHFMPTAEVNTIFTKDGRSRKVHHVIAAPSLEVAAEVSNHFKKYGDLSIDGRPILPIYASRLAEMVFGVSEDCMIIPAHVWTPHFSVFGSNSGFDKIEDCYEEYTDRIFALETGLSSDPPMNWRLSALDRYALVSCSDAHSPSKLGREAVIFDCELDYAGIREALKEKDPRRLKATIEFFPEEGKYHYDGHRACGKRLTPKEAIQQGNKCPQCGRKLSPGVLHRVEELADRRAGERPENAIDYISLVPLEEIIASALEMGVGTQRVSREYRQLVARFGNEFTVLLDAKESEILEVAEERVAQGIAAVRRGQVHVEPGYDGEYGKIELFGPKPKKPAGSKKEQMELF